MCGRYVSSRSAEELAAEFDVHHGELPRIEPDYNVAPTDPVYAVVERPAGERPPERQLRVMRWGLVPFWSKDATGGARMINARVETVASKPAFRRAFAKRRAILPADGYYEWYATDDRTRSGKPRKQPYYVRPADDGVLAMAGLYEIWRDPAKAEDDPDRFFWSTTVLTTTATDDLGRIHDRMPMMVPAEHREAWLATTTDADGLLDLLRPAVPGELVATPVSSLVSNVRNNGPELIAPLPVEEA